MPETAYLYDAVHLYERSLLKALDENRDPRNGREMVATLYGVHYRSAMGYVRDRGREREREDGGIDRLSRRFTACKSASSRGDLSVAESKPKTRHSRLHRVFSSKRLPFAYRNRVDEQAMRSVTLRIFTRTPRDSPTRPRITKDSSLVFQDRRALYSGRIPRTFER